MADVDKKVKVDFDVKDNKNIQKVVEQINSDMFGKLKKSTQNYLEETKASMEAFNASINSSSIFANMKAKAAAKRANQENFAETIKEFKENFKTLHPVITAFAKTIAGIFSKTFKSIFSDIKKGIIDAFDPTKGIASYDMGSSLFMNARAREMSMRYGISSGQTYALDKTMNMLGMSEEDLMWMNSAQKEKFNEMMTKYNSFYDEMQSSGVMQKVQEAQLEVKMLKEDLKNKFLLWIAENKDVIITCITGIMNILKGIANVVSSIFNVMNFSKWGSSANALSAEELNNASNYNNSSINLTSNVNQTNNISSEADAKDVMDTLSNTNIKRYRQAIEAYK